MIGYVLLLVGLCLAGWFVVATAGALVVGQVIGLADRHARYPVGGTVGDRR